MLKNGELMTEISNWMHVDYFTVDQASALWCDFDPMRLRAFMNDNPPEVMAAKQLLIGGIVSGTIKSDSSRNAMQIIGNFSETLISRAELEKFARMKKLFPAFLFDTLAPFEKPESPWDKYGNSAVFAAPTPKLEPSINQGGRPPQYDWDNFMLEIIRRANSLDGLPDSQADLVREMQEWFSVTTGSEPAESSIKLRTSKVYKYLSEGKAKVKNPDS